MRLLKVSLHNVKVQPLTDETVLIVPKSQPLNAMTFRSFRHVIIRYYLKMLSASYGWSFLLLKNVAN